jgi:hypothetical protein
MNMLGAPKYTVNSLLHALDLLRSFDMRLQSSLAGRDNLCVGIDRLPQ